MRRHHAALINYRYLINEWIDWLSCITCIIVSYNMHGYNQGVHYMKQLCSSADLIFLQEHWLPPSDLHRLQNISDDFICFSSSAMGYAIDKGVLVGRPFGGVAILVRSSLARHCKLLRKTERYIIVKLADSILLMFTCHVHRFLTILMFIVILLLAFLRVLAAVPISQLFLVVT